MSATSQRSTQRPNGHRAIGRAAQPTRRANRTALAPVKHQPNALLELTGRITPGIRFESSKHPLTTGRVRSIVTGRATVFDRPRVLQTLWVPDWTRRSHE
jgi:hypothetical protein